MLGAWSSDSGESIARFRAGYVLAARPAADGIEIIEGRDDRGLRLHVP
jgi:hypothetical protein